VQIAPFSLERYYERWEFRAELMLSSSDCESRTVADLLALEPDAERRLLELHLGYTEVAGSPELRAAIAGRHEHVEPGDVLTVAAAEEGIFIVCHGLLEASDHVVIETPCYGSALELARSTGASVSVWQRHHEDGWAYDLEALRALLRANTKLIYINSPHNPTGSHMQAAVFERVLALAADSDIVLLSDEVYRGLEHNRSDRLPAACERYERAITLGAVSKAYGLPGLRVGWLASRDPRLIERAKEIKLYTTICSSAPSELLVALAVRHAEQLIAANRELVLGNLPLLDALLERRGELFEWVRPTAGPVGFPRVAADIDVHAWCEQIAAQANVLLLPGTVYGEPRHVRFGFGRANLAQAVERLDGYLEHL
jgi:aspartate/methionine/tyrosine aminotransferase